MIGLIIYILIAYNWSIIFFIFLKLVKFINDDQLDVYEYIYNDENRSEIYIILNIGIGYCLAFTC